MPDVGKPCRIRWVRLLVIAVALYLVLQGLDRVFLPRAQQVVSMPHDFQLDLVSIASAHDAPAAKSAIARLRRFLGGCPEAEAVSVIRQFLDSGEDAPTGLGFAVNGDGSLREAPTLRVLLLDILGKLAPAQAAESAKRILQRNTSPDEWAVSLAIYARSDPSAGARAFLQKKTEEMALYAPWRTSPSTGFLEAFDLFVYTHDTRFVPTLSQMADDNDNPAVAHAAFLALDRLVESDPCPTLQTLLDQPALMQGREATRAGYFARADARDPAQQQLLSEYMLSPDRSPAELEAFAGLFPNENFLISYNLLTKAEPLAHQEVLSRYEAARQLIRQWQSDTRFVALRPQLNCMLDRINRILGR